MNAQLFTDAMSELNDKYVMEAVSYQRKTKSQTRVWLSRVACFFLARAFEQKERRHSDECRRTEADQLSFGQIEKHFGFHPRKVTRDRDISGHTKPSFLLVGAEYALCQGTGLEQSKTQKDGVTHNAPDGCDDVIRERYRLDKYSVYANTDDD